MTDITVNQKIACSGEFFVEIEVTCPCQDELEQLVDVFGEPIEECDVCGGLGGWIQKEMIPWTTIKDIYKMMEEAK